MAGRGQRVAAGIRRRVLEHTIKNNGGYLSQACSSAEILATLYVRVMDLGKIETPLVPKPFPGVPGPQNPDYFTGASFNGPGPDKDRSSSRQPSTPWCSMPRSSRPGAWRRRGLPSSTGMAVWWR